MRLIIVGIVGVVICILILSSVVALITYVIRPARQKALFFFWVPASSGFCALGALLIASFLSGLIMDAFHIPLYGSTLRLLLMLSAIVGAGSGCVVGIQIAKNIGKTTISAKLP